MAVLLVDGPPGSGKSFCCVRWMVDILRNTERPILTNITINKTVLAAVACYYERAKITLDTVRDYRKRLHIVGEEEIRNFWNLPAMKNGKPYMRNAAVFLDELHMYFRSSDWKSAEEELTDFLAEHRKGGLDFYCISQSKDRVLVDIRKMAEGCYFIRNSMTQSVYPGSWFGRVRWPVQFFILKYAPAEGGKMRMRNCQTSTSLMPWGNHKLIFRCYRSFAANSDFDALAGAEDLESGSHKDKGLLRNIASEVVRCPAQFLVAGGIFAAMVSAPWIVSQIDDTGSMINSAFGVGDDGESVNVQSAGGARYGGSRAGKPAGSGASGGDSPTIYGRGDQWRVLVTDMMADVVGVCPRGLVMSDGAFYSVSDDIRIGEGICSIEDIDVQAGRWSWSYVSESADVQGSGTSRLRKSKGSGRQPKTKKLRERHERKPHRETQTSRDRSSRRSLRRK